MNEIDKLNELVDYLREANAMLENQLFALYNEKDEDTTSSLVTEYQKSQKSKTEAI